MKFKEEMEVFSDDKVIASVREGNVRNFEILIERYKTKIINFVFRMILDYDEAQNISQEVFLKIFKNIKNYKENDNFQSFIYTIAKNMTLNYIKKQKRVVLFSSFSREKEEEKYTGISGTQVYEIEKIEKDKLVTEALRLLNENQRLVLIMKVYLGFSYKKIRDITGWTIPKIETLISRAKQSLKKNVIMQERGDKVVK
ncbi:MAG: RNA polymerase sigma factor [Acidobacteriota bacterium]